jgi:hypothetical protein
MIEPPVISGTFIDEITHDIPSQNWGPEEWEREFDLYTHIGVDTLVIIRAGYRDRCLFDSKVVPDCLPAYGDLAKLLLELAAHRGLQVFIGLYDSGYHWLRGAWWQEVEINRHFIEELVARYGDCPAWKGWYICHETSRNDVNIVNLFRCLGAACKEAKDAPVLISPFPQGAKQFSGAEVMSVEESAEHWDHIFRETRGALDICAFQDGQIALGQLPHFARTVRELGDRHGLTIWSNVESFDRDVALRFPPADWRILRRRLEVAMDHADKIITFEFPHFLSPHSCYPAAHNLFQRYVRSQLFSAETSSLTLEGLQ